LSTPITLRSGASRYQARWRDPAGKQRARNFRRKFDADRYERKMRAEVDGGTYRDPKAGKVTLEDWCEQWLAGAHNLKPKTRLIYQQALAHILPVLGDQRLDNVTPEAVDAYLSGRLAGAAPSSVHREYRTLRRAFRLAVQRDRLHRSPIDAVTEPRVPPDEMRFLSASELELLAATIVGPLTGKGTGKPATGYDALILTAGWGGLRWGELAGLRTDRVDVAGSRVQVVRQVDPAGRVWSEPKANSMRWVTLPASVMDRLADHIEGKPAGGLVWEAARGGTLVHSRFLGHLELRDKRKRVTRRQRGYFRPALYRAGIDTAVRPHDLRHTAVALAIRAGAHPKAIQARMGHSSIQVTLDRYGHLYPEMDGELAEGLDTLRANAVRVRMRVVTSVT
jgi:integrase